MAHSEPAHRGTRDGSARPRRRRPRREARGRCRSGRLPRMRPTAGAPTASSARPAAPIAHPPTEREGGGDAPRQQVSRRGRARPPRRPKRVKAHKARPSTRPRPFDDQVVDQPGADHDRDRERCDGDSLEAPETRTRHSAAQHLERRLVLGRLRLRNGAVSRTRGGDRRPARRGRRRSASPHRGPRAARRRDAKAMPRVMPAPEQADQRRAPPSCRAKTPPNRNARPRAKPISDARHQRELVLRAGGHQHVAADGQGAAELQAPDHRHPLRDPRTRRNRRRRSRRRRPNPTEGPPGSRDTSNSEAI